MAAPTSFTSPMHMHQNLHFSLPFMLPSFAAKSFSPPKQVLYAIPLDAQQTRQTYLSTALRSCILQIQSGLLLYDLSHCLYLPT